MPINTLTDAEPVAPRAADVLVVGDVMLDRYIQGEVSRISPEAPVPVVRLRSEFCRPGGAANVAASVAALGVPTTLIGIVGDDAEGSQLEAETTSYGPVECQFRRWRNLRTISKTRIVATSFHQFVRLDQDGDSTAFAQAADSMEDTVCHAVRNHSLVILADYDKGTVTPQIASLIIQECRRLGKPCLVDPKKSDFRVYRGAMLLTPNVAEAERALSRSLTTQEELEQAAQDLRTQASSANMVITRGAEGMLCLLDGTITHIPAARHAVADVSGAGDTVIATLAACLAQGHDLIQSCTAASIAAGIAVSHPGTYVVTREEFEAAIAGNSPKIVSWSTARHRVHTVKAAGRRVVFTNGCFDLLHAGHLSCLQRARQLGDFLVVGLNSDSSVRLNKGNKRPIIDQVNRAQLLAGLASVDMVVLFDQLTPEELIRSLGPDVLVKGSDYDASAIAGAEFVSESGGKVVTLPLIPGLSTTTILSRVGAAS